MPKIRFLTRLTVSLAVLSLSIGLASSLVVPSSALAKPNQSGNPSFDPCASFVAGSVDTQGGQRDCPSFDPCASFVTGSVDTQGGQWNDCPSSRPSFDPCASPLPGSADTQGKDRRDCPTATPIPVPGVEVVCGGSVTFSGVPEGWYVVVEPNDHLFTFSGSSGTFALDPGTYNYEFRDAKKNDMTGGTFTIDACAKVEPIFMKIISGGTATFSDFTFTISQDGIAPVVVPGADLDPITGVYWGIAPIGAYTITETGSPANYTASYQVGELVKSTNCSFVPDEVAPDAIVVAPVEICTITNTYRAPAQSASPTVKPTATAPPTNSLPSNGGSGPLTFGLLVLGLSAMGFAVSRRYAH